MSNLRRVHFKADAVLDVYHQQVLYYTVLVQVIGTDRWQYCDDDEGHIKFETLKEAEAKATEFNQLAIIH